MVVTEDYRRLMRHRHKWQFLRYGIAEGKWWKVFKCVREKCPYQKWTTGIAAYRLDRYILPVVGLRYKRDVWVGVDEIIELKEECKQGWHKQKIRDQEKERGQ